MSQQQLADLEMELSQLVTPDERMLLEYEIRFWKQKAWRAEQQRDRAETAQKEAEELTKKYKSIPQEVLERFVLEVKEKELKEVKDAAYVHMPTIGLTNFRRLSSHADLLDNIDAKINLWKEVIGNHRAYAPCDEEEEEGDESD
jgi:hypothetical protein